MENPSLPFVIRTITAVSCEELQVHYITIWNSVVLPSEIVQKLEQSNCPNEMTLNRAASQSTVEVKSIIKA